MIISEKVNAINESETVKFTSLIERLRKEGKEIIDLAVGEPDIETPAEIIEATKKALEHQKTKYSPVSGISELKKAICRRLNETNLNYSPDNIIISNGSKQSLYNIFQVICNPGDEVIILRPYWVSFSEQVKLAGALPIFVDTVNHQPDIDKIRQAVTPRTRAIIINSPNNPTGAVYKKEDLNQIAELALGKDFFIISDEAYDSLVYDGLKNFSIASFGEKIKKRTFTVKTFSKEFSMTGFRIGYVAAEKELIDAMNKLQGHVTGNVCTFAQYGAIAALDINGKEIEKRRQLFEKRRDLAFNLASKLFECIKPQGAFYLFPNVKNVLGSKIKKSEELSAWLLEKANVAVVPGESFGAKDHIRISYAASEENIRKGFERIGEVL